jgi:hypothetical protein
VRLKNSAASSLCTCRTAGKARFQSYSGKDGSVRQKQRGCLGLVAGAAAAPLAAAQSSTEPALSVCCLDNK